MRKLKNTRQRFREPNFEPNRVEGARDGQLLLTHDTAEGVEMRLEEISDLLLLRLQRDARLDLLVCGYADVAIDVVDLLQWVAAHFTPPL